MRLGDERLLAVIGRPVSTLNAIDEADCRYGRNAGPATHSGPPTLARIVLPSNRRIGHQIYGMEVATREQTRLFGRSEGGCKPCFSPDGQRIICAIPGSSMSEAVSSITTSRPERSAWRPAGSRMRPTHRREQDRVRLELHRRAGDLSAKRTLPPGG